MPNLGSDYQHVCSGSEVSYSIVSRILGIVYIQARYNRLTISRFATVSKLHVPVHTGCCGRQSSSNLFTMMITLDNSHLYGISSTPVFRILRVSLGEQPFHYISQKVYNTTHPRNTNEFFFVLGGKNSNSVYIYNNASMITLAIADKRRKLTAQSLFSHLAEGLRSALINTRILFGEECNTKTGQNSSNSRR